MHPRDKTHIKTGIKHEMWVWKAIFYAVSLKSNCFFFERMMVQTSDVCVCSWKRENNIPIKSFFLLLFVYDIEKNCGRTSGVGKTQSCWAKRQVGKQTFGSSTQLLLNSIYLPPDRISFNFMEVLLTLVLLA